MTMIEEITAIVTAIATIVSKIYDCSRCHWASACHLR